jgi:transposase
MLVLPRLSALDESLSVGVYLCTAPTDMRKGFDSLAALVTEHLGRDPLSGDFLAAGRILALVQATRRGHVPAAGVPARPNERDSQGQ